MIRPLTCLTLLLAFGSGLYLYQAKHRVKIIDQQIAETVKATEVLREQTRMLSAEWTLLNDPERLRLLSNQFLTLQTVSPGQFTGIADLDSRLPPPVPPGTPVAAATAPVETAPVAAAPAAEVQAASVADARAGDVPAPPPAAPPPAAPTQARETAPAPRVAAIVPAEAPRADAHKPPVTRPAALSAVADTRARPPAPRVAEQRSPEPRPDARAPEQRFREQAASEARPVVAARTPVLVPVAAPASGGSFLGMAHGMTAPPAPVPLPRPVPVSAPQYSYSNGG